MRDVKTRKVIFHFDALLLTDVTFKVSQAGRERVLREQRKNVHAGVEGLLMDNPPLDWFDCKERVRYNPYEAAYFRDEADRKIVHAKAVFLNNEGKVYFT